MSMVIVRIAALLSGALGLLCGCLQQEHALLEAPGPRPAAVQPSSPYTANRTEAARNEVLSVRIDAGFDAYERAKILRAVNEWNHVLNGHARFEIVETNARYQVLAVNGGQANSPAGLRIRSVLATVVGTSDARKAALVFVDRLGNRDLKALMLHEFGHILGLPHATEGVMSPEYDLVQWRCIGRTSAAALAARRGLPLTQLNWCEG